MVRRAAFVLVALATLLSVEAGTPLAAQIAQPAMLHPRLGVRPVVEGLITPSSMAFLGPNEMLVVEKNTGQVKHVVNGEVTGVALDLAVNFASERGLLGIALHPDFPANPGVYLYWSCRSLAPPADPFFPAQQRCSNDNILGADSDNIIDCRSSGTAWIASNGTRGRPR
jgi:glucose/arabinose dehydrogenase